MAARLEEAFTATGAGTAQVIKAGDYHVRGTFVGTVQLQRFMDGVWVPIAEHTAATTSSDNTVIENGTAKPMRFECTAFTSGTINCWAE